MFVINTDDTSVYIIGIDPGSMCLGLCLMELDVITRKIKSTQAKTIKVDKLFYSDNLDDEVLGGRLARIKRLSSVLTSNMNSCKPIAVACESPFFSHLRPSAFGVLMEVLNGVRDAVHLYSPWMKLDLIDPPTVKKSVGASGAAKKDQVYEKVFEKEMKDKEFNFLGNSRVDCLDEHSIDAVCVAYCFYKNVLMKAQSWIF